MRRHPFLPVAAAASLAAAACAHSNTPQGGDKVGTSSVTSPATQATEAWPLRFRTHSFSAYAFDTYGAHVEYAGVVQLDQDDTVLQPSSSSRGAGYRERWDGTHIGIDNFPGAAKLRWRSKDGAAHQANIDIPSLFAEQTILHRVPREEVSPQPAQNGQHTSPAILIEINDRTVHVYMRAMIHTLHPQVAGNPRSRFRFDLVPVKTLVF